MTSKRKTPLARPRKKATQIDVTRIRRAAKRAGIPQNAPELANLQAADARSLVRNLDAAIGHIIDASRSADFTPNAALTALQLVHSARVVLATSIPDSAP